jgi:uncharacterized protein YbaP (TraB family)
MHLDRILLCVVCLLIGNVAFAATPPVPLLWKVSDADNSVYLLGSFHMLQPDDYPLSADAEHALRDSKAVVFEIPPDEMASPELSMQMMQAGMRSDGKQLDDDLSPALRTKLATWLASHQTAGIAPEMLQQLRPWLAGLLIGVSEMTAQGMDPSLGLDQHFANEAKAAGKPTSGLETGPQQIAFLAAMDHDEQLQFLDEALSESDAGQRELQALHAAWRTGDAATLWNVMARQMQRDYPKLYRHIDVERNDAWLPKIEQRLRTPGHDNTLIVVGALHLLGRDGVVEKLKAAGYRVERVCTRCNPVTSGKP